MFEIEIASTKTTTSSKKGVLAGLARHITKNTYCE
jgi:hypothetical protein